MTRPMLPIAVVSAATVAFAALPALVNNYYLSFLLVMFMYVSLAGSWNILSGFAGYPSFGHVAFFGIGSYTAALLITRADIGWPIAVVMGGLVAGVAATLIGTVVLRLRSVFFAIATLGLAESLRVLAQSWDGLTKGGMGISIPPAGDVSVFYYAMLVTAALAMLLNYLVGRSDFGLRLLAIRDDEDAASSTGINTTQCKTAAFVLSSILPGVAGGIYAQYISYIEPAAVFSVLITIQMVAMALLGGAGTVFGPVIGVVVLSVIGEIFWAKFPFIQRGLYGALIMLVVFLMPGGIMDLLQSRGVLRRRRTI